MSIGGGEAGERSGGAEALEPTQSGTDGGGTAIPKKDQLKVLVSCVPSCTDTESSLSVFGSSVLLPSQWLWPSLSKRV